jgi:putative tricarboxylic transport membrane protein
LGVLILIYLASSSILKALMMAVFGLLLGTIGMDSISGTQRLTFGIIELSDGVGLIPVIMGVFGVTEVITNVEEVIKQELVTTKVKNLLPSLQD